MAAVEYAFQKQSLDEFFVTKGEDIFASSLFVRERADDSIWSFTSWVMDVDSVLPRADYVAVVVGPGEQFMVSWDDALAAAGAALSPVKDTSPPRWRGPGWPSAAVLDRLRALEVDPTTTSAPEPVH